MPGGGSDVTVRDVVERGLRCFAANTAVIDGERRETYAELADRSGRLANVVTATGRGRPVAVWLPNCLEYVEADVACMRAGATRVAVGDRLSADETEYILGHCGAGVLITTAELYGRLRDHRAAPADVEVLLVDGAPSYEEALARATARLDVAIVAARAKLPGVHQRHHRPAEGCDPHAARQARVGHQHARLRAAPPRRDGRLRPRYARLSRIRLQSRPGPRVRRGQPRAAPVRP